jgi:hypothetical protein
MAKTVAAVYEAMTKIIAAGLGQKWQLVRFNKDFGNCARS